MTMNLDTYLAAKALAKSILLQEETAEVNNYGELVTHLADLIEDYELEEEQEREQIEG